MDSMKELTKLRQRNLIESLNRDMELKAEKERLTRRLNEEKAETVLEEMLARAQKGAQRRADDVRLEEELAFHMSKIKRQDICHQKQRQKLLDMNELVELKNKIRNAYFTKALHGQLVESQAIKSKEKCESEECKLRLEKQLQQLQAQEAELQTINELKKRQYRNDLQDQIIDSQKKKLEEQEQKLLDMQLVDDATRTILFEDKALEDEVKRKRQLVRADHEAHLRAQHIWKLREKEVEEEENKKIQEYLCKAYEHEKRLQEMNRKKFDEKTAAQERLLLRIQQIGAGREEREQIAQILCDEQIRLDEENKEKKKKEQMIQRAQEMKETVEGFLKDKLLRAEEENKLNEQYRQKLAADIEDAKREERQDQKKMNDKKKQYGSDLREGMRQVFKNRSDEKFQSAVYQAIIEREKEELLQQIAEERRRIINEHGPQLYGYLPKNLVTEEDVQHLNSDIREYFSSRPK